MKVPGSCLFLHIPILLAALGQVTAFQPPNDRRSVILARPKKQSAGGGYSSADSIRRRQQQRLETAITMSSKESGPTTTTDSINKLSVAILIFDNVEVLDFTGPYEVFSRTRLEAGTAARRTEDTAPFRVFTVAVTTAEAESTTVSATGNLKVVADYNFSNVPKIDILLVPGGFGTRSLLNNEEVIQWIQSVSPDCKLVTSVCTGALLLAKAGLLNGRRATSHWASLDLLQEVGGGEEMIEVERTLRWVDDGDIISSAGVAAGIDMAFHVVERLCGKDVADETAYYIEYPRRLATDPRSTTVASPTPRNV